MSAAELEQLQNSLLTAWQALEKGPGPLRDLYEALRAVRSEALGAARS